MQVMIRKLSSRLFRDGSVVSRWRSERMLRMVRLLNLPAGTRVVDLGGSEYNWKLFDHDFHITLVNLPGFNAEISDPDRFCNVEGDACDLAGVFGDQSFDLAFSNSTIEHVGGPDRRAAFAAECRRLAPAYWVQTPSPRFPVEIHTGVPFFFRLPAGTRRRMIDSWSRRLPGWADMIRATDVVAEEEMRRLFPDAEIFRERRYGFEKSYSFYRPLRAGKV